MSLRLPLTILLASAPLAAQDYAPDLPRLEALTAAVEAGDQSLRGRLEREGRHFFIWAAQRSVTGTTAHLVARVGLAVGAPFAPPDSAVSQREVFWRSGLVRALHSALAADSGDMIAAELLERLEPYPHIWMEPDRQLAHLRALSERHAELPIALSLGHVGLELERGDPNRALEMLLRLNPDSAGLVRWNHLHAQANFARGQDEGERRYYEGAGRIAAAADAEVYRSDLVWIAEPEEIEEFDALVPGDSAHAVWLRKFWTRRDLEDLRPPGTRLREHFARWRLALKEYRWDREGLRVAGRGAVPAMGLEYNGTEDLGDVRYPRSRYIGWSELFYAGRLRPVSVIIDDRGNAVMRHGPPDQEVVLPGITSVGQTLMAWRQPGGTLVMSFSGPGVVPGGPPSLLWGMIARNMPVGDLQTGCEIDPELCVLAGLVRAGGDPEAQSTRTRNRYDVMRREAETTDGNPERFARPLEAYVQSYGIAGGGVLVSYAIRARDLDGGMAWLRIVAGSVADGEIVGTLDTDRRWSLPADPDAFVAGWTVVSAPAGTWRVGVVLSDFERERGHGASFDDVPVIPAALTSGLRLSDPILGRENSGLRWNRLGRSIPLNPTGAWLRNEEGVLSAEVYGLVPGRGYRLEIELREGSGDDAPSRLVITETLVPDAPMLLLQRNLSFANLDAGTYRLVVRVTDAENGESAERERLVPVR